MLGIIFAGYVAIAIVFFFGFAAYYWSHNQSVGALWFTMWIWPIFIPLMLMMYVWGKVARLGGQIERNERRERLARKVNEIDRGGKLPWE
jgi:uncharacterized membrane protein